MRPRADYLLYVNHFCPAVPALYRARHLCLHVSCIGPCIRFVACEFAISFVSFCVPIFWCTNSMLYSNSCISAWLMFCFQLSILHIYSLVLQVVSWWSLLKCFYCRDTLASTLAMASVNLCTIALSIFLLHRVPLNGPCIRSAACKVATVVCRETHLLDWFLLCFW